VIGHRVVKLPYRLPSFQLTIKSVVSDVEPLLAAEPAHGAPLGDRHQPRPGNARDALAGPLLQGRDEGVLASSSTNPTSYTIWVSGREIAVLAGRVYLRHDPPITPAGACKDNPDACGLGPREQPLRGREVTASARGHGHRDLVPAPERKSPRRVIEPGTSSPDGSKALSRNVFNNSEVRVAMLRRGRAAPLDSIGPAERRAQRSRVGDPGPHYAGQEQCRGRGADISQ
jgi:hypothetical protein